MRMEFKERSIPMLKLRLGKRKILWWVVIICATIFLSVNGLSAQEKLFHGNKHKLMLGAGYGFKEPLIDHADYYYRALLFTLQYQYNIFQKKSFGIDFLVQAQYNFSTYAYDIVWVPDIERGYEFGAHPGFVFRKNFWEDELSVFGIIMAGPHYISGSLNRQASGFVFSDNFILGADIKLSRTVYFEMSIGFRHLSSADLTSPNDGINNLIVSGGIVYLINPKKQIPNSK
jgi:hypothetical protein